MKTETEFSAILLSATTDDDGQRTPTIETIGYSGLESLQAAVGGLVEAHELRHPGTGAELTLWFNEEGKASIVNHETRCSPLHAGHL